MLDLTVKPVSAVENTLSILGRKFVSTGNLTPPEELMARTTAARELRSYYGPDLKDIEVHTTELPESVKGLLADHAS